MITQDEWLEAASEPLDMTEMDNLLRKSVEAWEKRDQLKKLEQEAYKEAEKIDHQILAALTKAGKTKYFTDGVGTVSIIRQAIVRIPSTIEEKRKFFEYLHSRGEEVFLSLASVNSMTLNSWYREALEEAASQGIVGFSVPGIGEPTTRETLRLLRDKKGKT